MIKNNKGITLATLMVTVIILFILAGVGISTTYTGVTEIKDNKLTAELGIVRQAILEQYALAEAVNQIHISKEERTSFVLVRRTY